MANQVRRTAAGLEICQDDDDKLAFHGADPVARQTVTLTSTDSTAADAADLAALKAEAENIGDDVRAMHAALVALGLFKSS